MSIHRFMHHRRKDQDLAEEFEAHLAHQQDKISRAGCIHRKPVARLVYALEILSDAGRIGSYSPFPWLEDLWRDRRFALRRLQRFPDLPSSPFL